MAASHYMCFYLEEKYFSAFFFGAICIQRETTWAVQNYVLILFDLHLFLKIKIEKVWNLRFQNILG